MHGFIVNLTKHFCLDFKWITSSAVIGTPSSSNNCWNVSTGGNNSMSIEWEKPANIPRFLLTAKLVKYLTNQEQRLQHHIQCLPNQRHKPGGEKITLKEKSTKKWDFFVSGFFWIETLTAPRYTGTFLKSCPSIAKYLWNSSNAKYLWNPSKCKSWFLS